MAQVSTPETSGTKSARKKEIIKCVVVGDAVNEPYGNDKRGSSKVAFLTSYATNEYPSERIPSVVSFLFNSDVHYHHDST